MNHDPNCIFCKIIEGKIPSKKVYEDEDVYAFYDINPAAPIHFLIIPKTHIAMLADSTMENQQILGKMMLLAPKLALEAGAITVQTVAKRFTIYTCTCWLVQDHGNTVYQVNLTYI